jgi:hypothetical protein
MEKSGIFAASASPLTYTASAPPTVAPAEDWPTGLALRLKRDILAKLSSQICKAKREESVYPITGHREGSARAQRRLCLLVAEGFKNRLESLPLSMRSRSFQANNGHSIEK